jgi:outer membrane protein OmpA-like peptidoglycan-associated protein
MIMLNSNIKKSFALVMIFMMMAIQSAMAQQGKNLVQNGKFEQGHVGFKNDFRFFPYRSFKGLIVEGSYTIMDSFPYQVNRFSNYFLKLNSYGNLVRQDNLDNSDLIMEAEADPERTSVGNFLAVNVNESGKIWYDSITIKPNTIYSFSCIVANVYYTPPTTVTNSSRNYYEQPKYNNLASPGVMKLCVNGEKVKLLNMEYSNEWTILRGRFTSGPDQTRIEISIQDRPWSLSIWSNRAVHYAAVDNIVFKEIKPVKKIPPAKKEEPIVLPKPVKKDTTSKIVAVSADFKKDISIDKIKVDQKFQLNNIYFERSKFKLLAASTPKLNDLVTFMKKYSTVRIRLEGHTDNVGDPKKNLELSENRAKEVKKYLVDQGIDENRIKWIGYGGQRPINNNANEFLRQKNRRVEVVIISK